MRDEARSGTALWSGAGAPRLFEQGFDRGLCLVAGDGARVQDREGRWYVDARSALWNAALGFSHQGIIDAITAQAQALPVASAVRHLRPAAVTVDYADALAARLPAGLTRIRFCNTGSQAVETAVMLSRAVRILALEPERRVVLALRDGYHGAGGLASVLSNTAASARLGPLSYEVAEVDLPPESRAEDAITAKIREIGAARVTALILEPVIGEGLRSFPDATLHNIAALARASGLHLIVDEVTTGFGRTGDWTLSGAVGLAPDLLVLGKGMTAGYVPAAAVAVAEPLYREIHDAADLDPFPVGSTTDGHPLAMAAGLAVIEALEGGVLDAAQRRGMALRQGLEDLAQRHDTIRAVRGRGLMLGVEMTAAPGAEHRLPMQLERLRVLMEQNGVLAHPTSRTLTLLPPLVTTSEEAETILTALDASLDALAG